MKVDLRQVDVSQDLVIPTSSEGELYSYIDTLKDTMADLSSVLIDSMHGKLKKFGNTIKVTKKENKKAIKEVAKAYNVSKKKADKAKANCKDGTYDEAAMMAAERAAADLKVYEFYVDYACKRYRKDVLGVYKNWGSILNKKPKLKVTKKNRTKASQQNVTKVSIPTYPDEDEKEFEPKALKKCYTVKELHKNAKYISNPCYVKQVSTPIDESKYSFCLLNALNQ